MSETEQSHSRQKKEKSGDLFLEVWGWIRIAASPFIMGLAIGFGVYISNPNITRAIIAVSVAIIGLIVGIVWATKVWKRKGTMNFISKIYESPDLDYLDEDNKKT